ncbi:MAG TPA: hypothetical protein VEH27_01445 [Methylomirabilota bacterium]|nr:hypothetical protein [Methylomirabilota bacterium]
MTRRSSRKSRLVTLALSGTLLAGCAKREDPNDWADSSEVVTNNTYRPHLGYYHSAYGGWFPFPYNSFVPGRGYYHGGSFSPAPAPVPPDVSRPKAAPDPYVRRGGFGGYRYGGS